MSDFVSKPIQKKLNKNNPISRIEKVERDSGIKPSASVYELSELSISSGTLNEGAFIDPSDDSGSEEPTDPDFSGVFLTGDGFIPADEAGEFNLGFVSAGVTSYGIGEAGEYANGMEFVGVHKATGTSLDTRRLRRGFQELQGNDDPSYIFEYLDTNVGSNLITLNPGFETGDSTGWTLTGSNTEIYPTSVTGWGSFDLGIGGGATSEATSNKYACTAGNTLNASFEAAGIHENITVYIRFYNAVPTLLSSVVIKSWTSLISYGGVPNSFSVQTVVPTGATQFDIYIDRTSSSIFVSLYDNFSVTVVSISNEFGFHGEDGQLLMGNGKFKTNDLGAYIARGNQVGVVYANNLRTNISTAGNTTVFSITVPANFFSKGSLRFSCDAWVDQNANNRTLTGTLALGATSAAVALGGGGANVLTLWKIDGSVGKGGTNIQDLFARMESIVDNSSTVTKNGEYEAAAETESGAITCSFTLSLSGSVDAGWFNNVIVETIMNVDAW